MVDTLVSELFGDSAARREARRFALRESQPGRLVAASVVAVALVVGGGMVAVTVVSWEIGHPLFRGAVSEASRSLHRARWGERWVFGVGAGVVGVGVWLVTLAAVPGRTPAEPLRTGDPLLAAMLTRAGLGRVLLHRVLRVPGVSRVSVRVRGKRVEVGVETHERDLHGLQDRVRGAVTARMEALGLLRRRRVVVRVRRRD